jgi:hypothetical protein
MRPLRERFRSGVDSDQIITSDSVPIYCVLRSFTAPRNGRHRPWPFSRQILTLHPGQSDAIKQAVAILAVSVSVDANEQSTRVGGWWLAAGWLGGWWSSFRAPSLSHWLHVNSALPITQNEWPQEARKGTKLRGVCLCIFVLFVATTILSSSSATEERGSSIHSGCGARIPSERSFSPHSSRSRLRFRPLHFSS